MPDYRGSHIDALLTGFALGYKPEGFIADQIAPIVPSNRIKDSYRIYNTDNVKLYNTSRDPKGEANKMDQSTTTGSFHCKPHGLKDDIGPEDREAFPETDLEMATVSNLMDAMMINREAEVATLFTTSSNYDASFYTTLSGADQWDDGMSDPKIVCTDAAMTVKHGCMRKANAIILPDEVAKVLARHPKIIDEIKYTNQNLLNEFGLPPKLWGMQLFIAGASYDETHQGQTGHSFAEIWSDSVVIFFLNPAVTYINPAFVKTFRYKFNSPNGYYVKKYPKGPQYNDNLITVEVNDEGRDSVVCCDCAGYLIQDVLASV
jgi:hypothetical protein